MAKANETFSRLADVYEEHMKERDVAIASAITPFADCPLPVEKKERVIIQHASYLQKCADCGHTIRDMNHNQGSHHLSGGKSPKKKGW